MVQVDQMALEYQETVEKVRSTVEKYAATGKVRLNPDRLVVDRVIRGLVRNKLKWGRAYCPWKPVKGDPVQDRGKVCPCKWHLQEIAENGRCGCRLYAAAE